MSIDLKPCPFCEAPAALCQKPALGETHVTCSNLDCLNHYDYPVAFWNHRPLEAKQEALITRGERLFEESGAIIDRYRKQGCFLDGRCKAARTASPDNAGKVVERVAQAIADDLGGSNRHSYIRTAKAAITALNGLSEEGE
jgi:hypothetical protein